MLQMKLFEEYSRDLSVPTSFQKLTIDTKRHAAEVQELNAKNSDVGKLVQFCLHNIVQV
jgi:hypothetical protein